MEQNYNLQSLDGLSAGQHFLYNGIEFVKLGDEQGGILCVTAEPWTSVPFDKAEHNNFVTSSVRDVLNSSFLPMLLRDDKDLCTYEMDLTADDGDRSYGTVSVLVGLLSADLYRKYRNYIPAYNTWMWLCTPWCCSDDTDCVRIVNLSKTMTHHGAGNVWGVVPAVIFKKDTIIRLKNS